MHTPATSSNTARNTPQRAAQRNRLDTPTAKAVGFSLQRRQPPHAGVLRRLHERLYWASGSIRADIYSKDPVFGLVSSVSFALVAFAAAAQGSFSLAGSTAACGWRTARISAGREANSGEAPEGSAICDEAGFARSRSSLLPGTEFNAPPKPA